MINELELERLCKRYKIKSKVFKETGIIILDSGLDEWQIKYIENKIKPYCLLHKNKCKQTSKFHVQRWLRTLPQSIDCVANHKKVLSQLYVSPNTYKNKNKK